MKQRESYLGKLFGQLEKDAEKALARYSVGETRCDRCKVTIDFESCQPLSFEKCPNCGDLIFVPLDLGQWWIVSPLGAGGFGSVYLGRSKDRPKSKVAVKLLQQTKDMTQGVVDNFRHEIEVASLLGSYPRLADIYASGEVTDRHFMVMEFVEGTRFNEYVVAQGSKLPSEECFYYALDMIDALEFIFDSGFIYRDVKPENMIVRDADHMIVLVDFGSALPVHEAADSGDLPIIGSPLCMAPERYLREGEDCRSDIYSLGMVMYFALKGEYYYAPTEIQRIMSGHTRKLRVPLRFKMKEFDPEIADLIDGMIKRNRDERFQSLDELKQAIFWVLAELHKTKPANAVVRSRRSGFLKTYGRLEREA